MNAKCFGLLGYPLGHSVSPFIHAALMKQKGVDGSYGLYEILPQQLAASYPSRLKTLDGFNVTIPHKTAVIPYLDALSERAALYGAVNTVQNQNGAFVGHNTDGIGFLRSLALADIPLSGRVLICGCGGVARMFAFESALAGAAVTLAVRKQSFNKAKALQTELAEKLSASCAIVLLNEVQEGYDLIINGTPVGMFPHADACPVSDTAIKNAAAVFDAVYNPAETVLIQRAKQYGKACVNGLPMLVIQAAATEEIWNGVSYTDEEIRDVIALTEKELIHG